LAFTYQKTSSLFLQVGRRPLGDFLFGGRLQQLLLALFLATRGGSFYGGDLEAALCVRVHFLSAFTRGGFLRLSTFSITTALGYLSWLGVFQAHGHQLSQLQDFCMFGAAFS
jgi:hypothetical protein